MSAPMSKDEALEKWEHYTDTAIRRAGLSVEKQMDGLVAAGATEDSLKKFWLEVKHFSWPGTFGQSPWEMAASLGASLEARDLGQAFRTVGMQYVEPFRAAVSRQRDAGVVSAIGDLSRASAIDLLDEWFGVGCYDEQDDEAVRDKVLAAYRAGQVDGLAVIDNH